MNCKSVEKWVWREGASNLPAAAIEHASGCSNCRMLIDQVRLLDRSVGASVMPEPGEEYWESLALRISRRLSDPTDRVIELKPVIPVWRRILAQTWAPATAVALLAVIASQNTPQVPTMRAIDENELEQRIAALSAERQRNEFRAESAMEIPKSTTATAADRPIHAESEPASRGTSTEVPREYSVGMSAEADQSIGSEMAAASVEANPSVPERPSRELSEKEQVWPDRQVVIMGQVDSNSPSEPLADDRRLAAQDPFGAYERQMAESEHGLESVGTFAAPGRLLDAPRSTPTRGAEKLTPAEEMRRFDEIAELRQLISRLEDVPESSRAMSQWTQWSTAWYRLGMLSDQPAVIDSAITAVGHFRSTVPIDSASAEEWQSRTTRLANRRVSFER